MSETDFSIYEIVRAIRKDLDKIRDDEGLQKDATLGLGSLEIELNAAVSKAAKGGIKFWLVELGGEAGKETGTKIRLHFEALEPLVQPTKTTGKKKGPRKRIPALRRAR